MKKIIVLRWLALIPAIYASWSVVLISGFYTHRLIERNFCPKTDLSSDACLNQTVINVLDITVHTFVALSAVAVLCTAIFIAPFYKKQISYVVFIVGSIIALYMGSQTQSWSLIVAAIVAGMSLLLAHSKIPFK